MTPEQRTVVTVSFPPTGRTGEFALDPERIAVGPGSMVVVEGLRGVRLGRVIAGPHPAVAGGRVRRVVRAAADADLAAQRRAEASEGELLRRTLAWVRDREVPWRVVRVAADGVGGVVTVCVAGEERLDVRDDAGALGRELRSRVVVRQVGVRDVAKVLGGVGRCGRELCCSTFLPEYPKTSIRQAKDQGLALSQDKTTGVCSRTLCCLAYEHDGYVEHSKWVPKQGKRARAGDLEGRVVAVDVLRQRFTLRTDDGARHLLDATAWERNEGREVPEPLVPPAGAEPGPVVAMPSRRKSAEPPSHPPAGPEPARDKPPSRRRRRGGKRRSEDQR